MRIEAGCLAGRFATPAGQAGLWIQGKVKNGRTRQQTQKRSHRANRVAVKSAVPKGEDGNQKNKPARCGQNGEGDKRCLFRMQVKIKGFKARMDRL